VLIVVAMISVVSGAVVAQQNAPAGPLELTPEERAIRNNAEMFVRAFNQGEAKQVAALFTSDSQMSHNGELIAVGREAIEEAYTQFFQQHPGIKISVTVESIRLLGPNLAIEKGTSQVESGGDESTLDAYTLVHVKRDGQWLTATADVDQQPAVPPMDWKKELGFLEGKWVAEAKGWRVVTTVEWVAGGNFMKRSFEVQNEGKTENSGIQVIGWDPIEGAVTSWTFGSDGGHGRGWWTRDGDNWIVHSEGTTAAGERLQATNMITMLGDDLFRWQSTDRSIGGFALDDTDSIRVQRVK
jgi:uncharacterized protein (TIGR02246 family)